MHVRTLLKYSPKFPLILIGPICILVSIVAGTRVSSDSGRWPSVQDWGAARALDQSSFVLATAYQAVIWHSPLSSAPLVYQALDQTTSSQVPLLPYPDVAPRRWAAAPAGPQSYHLVWLERDDRLRSALIQVDGTTLRGPIDLALSAQPDFVALSLPDNRLAVFWTSRSRNELSTVLIDQDGRPGPISTPAAEQARFIAAALDRDNTVHLVWLSSPEPRHWAIYYQAAGVANFNISTPTVLHQFALPPQETVTSLAVGLDQTHVYVFLSTTSAQQPEVEYIQMLVFPAGRPADQITIDLQLPWHAEPSGSLSAADLKIGRVAKAASPVFDPAALRWVYPMPGQHTFLPVAVAVQTPQGWRPAVVYYQNGDLLGFQVIAPDPANAGPPVLAADPAGDLHLAWQGLAGAVPHLFTASTAGRGWVPAASHEKLSLFELLARGLAGIPLGLAWLIFPTCVIALAPRNAWTPPLAFVLYGGAKLLWPRALFDHLPPLLNSAGLNRFSPGLVVYTVSLGIAMLSLVGYGLMYRRPLWQRWLAYALFDMVLTWIVFGANVSF